MSTPLHELAVIGYLLEQNTEVKDQLPLLYNLSLLEGKAKFQIYHMYLFLNKLLEKKDESTDVANKHYQNILIYEKMLHNLLFIKAHYEAKLKHESKYDIHDYIVKPEDSNIILEKPETKHMLWLEKKFKELNLFDLTNKSEHTEEVTISKKKVHAIEFYYADWCGYCTDFKPTWKKFKSQVRKNHKNILIREVNADDKTKQELRTKRKVQGYPTVVFVYTDKSFEFYDDERTVNKLLKKIN